MNSPFTSLKKSIHGGFSDEESDMLLIDEGGMLVVPGGIPTLEDIAVCPFKDERFIGFFLDRRLLAQAECFTPIKIQPMPAAYTAYTGNGVFDVEYSTFIVGDIDYRKVKSPNAGFYTIDDLIDFNKVGRISRPHYLMALRMFASRDWPGFPYTRKTAGETLRQQHQ